MVASAPGVSQSEYGPAAIEDIVDRHSGRGGRGRRRRANIGADIGQRAGGIRRRDQRLQFRDLPTE
eukprot:gene17689-31493_t